LPETGIFNAIYLLGDDLILRVPRDHPAHVAAVRKEAVAVPAARQAGVRTPRLVVFDDSLELLPVPFTVYERVHGETLGLLGLEPEDTPAVWRELGRDLARLHAGVGESSPAGGLGAAVGLPDPRERAEELASMGYVTASEARWLVGWLDRLSPEALTPVPRRFLHGDTQSTNVMVRPVSLDYLAVIDWGSASWGDSALDFQGVPLRAVPYLLEGHRAVAPLDSDETAEARILWRHLQLGLLVFPRRPDPVRSWAERPATMLLDVLRFFLNDPGGRWRELKP
jgi:aminoglycoside phosphotransferase (APT) family kinase protein